MKRLPAKTPKRYTGEKKDYWKRFVTIFSPLPGLEWKSWFA